MNIVLEIPVKRYVLNYIDTRYGTPWVISKRYKEGRMLINLLQRAPNKYEKFTTNQTVLKIRVNSDIINQYGCYLPQKNINEFNELIRQCILDDILNYSRFIKSGVGLKNVQRVKIMLRKEHLSPRNVAPAEGLKFFSQKEIINDILKKYDVDEADMTYDSIIKHLQRTLLHKL